MNDENKEFVNTEEPLEVSDEELKMLMERSKSAKEGNVCSHEEMEEFAQSLIDTYDDLSSYEEMKPTTKEDYHRTRVVNNI